MATDFVYKIRTFCIRISVHSKISRCNNSVIEKKEWLNMPNHVILKWMWYFKYREALLRIKYPHYYHSWTQWQIDPEGRTAIEMEKHQRKRDIITAKRMITKCKNAIGLYEEEENAKLLPNWEYEPYLKVCDKLVRYQLRLNELTINK